MNAIPSARNVSLNECAEFSLTQSSQRSGKVNREFRHGINHGDLEVTTDVKAQMTAEEDAATHSDGNGTKAAKTLVD
jgi:hypothetical protein